MISNITMLTHLLSTHQYGFVTITRFYTESVERMCPGYTKYCERGPHPYWEEVPRSEIVVRGMLRNYTVRESDILLTVLPWDKETKSLLGKRQLKYGLREKFELESGARLERHTTWCDIDLRIDLSPWSPTNIW